MNIINDTTLEAKRKKIQTVVKVLGFCVVAFFAAGTILTVVKGIIGIGVVALLSAIFYYSLGPISAGLANWRLKAFKAIAAANPIETLENRYSQLKDALLKQRENIKQRIAIASKIFEQIKLFEGSFKKPSPRREQYEKLNQLVDISKNKYQNAQINLVEFGKIIEEKRADWEIALSMAEANKLANVGEDFVSKLMQDTALNTVQQGLDMAFAELDAAVMDENIQKVLNGQPTEVTVSAPMPVNQKQLSAPTDLDFDFNGSPAVEVEAVSVKRRKAV